MAFAELQLRAQPDAWRVFTARKADPAFLKFCDKVFERDNYTCQFCGFQAKLFQEVVNRNNNYHDSKLSNLMTSCCFCAQCLFIESVENNDYGGGRLIYLPEISQAALNGLCHVLFCAIANATNYRGDAQSIYRSLKFRTQQVDQALGEGMSNPSQLGRILIEAQLEDTAKVAAKLFKDLRLLPSRTKFTTQIETWAESALDDMPGSE
jgi:intracellular multiplication protein IcmJ